MHEININNKIAIKKEIFHTKILLIQLSNIPTFYIFMYCVGKKTTKAYQMFACNDVMI